MPNTKVLITGANRGIGLGLAQAYAARKGYTVIVAVRKPEGCPAIKAAEGSEVIILKCDAGSPEDPKKMVEELKAKGVESLDLVIANAAIGDAFGPLSSIDVGVFEEHWRINTLGPLILFQAIFPLLKAGSKFIIISSGAGVIDREFDKQDAAYGVTKAAVNFLARAMHFENPEMIIFPLSPGWVQTEMGDRGAHAVGMKHAPITVDESVSGMTKVIDESTREKTSGIHMRYNGVVSKW